VKEEKKSRDERRGKVLFGGEERSLKEDKKNNFRVEKKGVRGGKLITN
jgi:hypothetical protein